MGETKDEATGIETVVESARTCWFALYSYAMRLDHSCRDYGGTVERDANGNWEELNLSSEAHQEMVHRDLIELAASCREGYAAISEHWKEFAQLHEHPVTFAGLAEPSYHNVVFTLSHLALSSVCRLVDPDFMGLGAAFDWSQFAENARRLVCACHSN